MTALTIREGMEISLHFSLRMESGDVVEDTRQYAHPATFQVGDGKLLPGFERKLVGLPAGVQRSFLIPAKDAFGFPKQENIQKHPTRVLGDIAKDDSLFKLGLVVGFKDTQGQEIPGVIREILVEEVLIDFNHPLAGKDILFEVDILDVQVAASPVSIQPLEVSKSIQTDNEEKRKEIQG